MYHDEDGLAVAAVARFDLAVGKTYRPAQLSADGWHLGDPPGPWPLYRLPELAEADRVYFVEGEKCARSSARSASSPPRRRTGRSRPTRPIWARWPARKWSVLPDVGSAGADYLARAVKLLAALEPRPTVKVVCLPALADDGDDVEQWAEYHDSWGPDALRAELERLALGSGAIDLDGEGAVAAAVGRLATTRLDAIRSSPLHWLVPSYIPLGKVVILAGEGGSASRRSSRHGGRGSRGASRASAWKRAATDPAEVLMIACEDGYEDTVVPYLTAAGADLGKIRKVDGIIQADGKPMPFGLTHFRALEEDLERNPGVRLVIVNPAGAYVGRSGADDHRNAELTALLEPLSDVATARNVTILLVCHLNKGVGSKAVHRVMGGAGYVNSALRGLRGRLRPRRRGTASSLVRAGQLRAQAPRPAFRIAPFDPDSRRRMLDSGCFPELTAEDRSTLISQLIRICWEKDSVNLLADDVLGRDNRQSSGPTKVEQAGEWLVKFLADGPRQSTVIFEEGQKAGFTKDNLYSANRRGDQGPTRRAIRACSLGSWRSGRLGGTRQS